MDILIKPLVTEKVSALIEDSKYGFIVHRKSNKVEIKRAIEKMYGVTVESVNTMICQGKKKSRQTKSRMIEGRVNSYKKAIVKVVDGDIIDFYGGI